MTIPVKFYTSVKSTIDFIGSTIAARIMDKYPTIVMKAIGMDATTGVTEELSSDNPAIVWSLQSFLEAPVDPLYELVFMIGPKTVNDVSGELMAVLVGEVQNYLPSRTWFDIKNYSGETVSEEDGERARGYVVGTRIEEQVYDNQVAMRMAVVAVKVVRDM